MSCAARARVSARRSSRIGLIPDTGILWSLPRRVGPARARELLGLAREVDAQEAARIGLADRVCESGNALSEAIGVAREFTRNPPLGMALIKSALTYNRDTMDAALQAEIDFQPVLRSSADHKEAARAFMEKRRRASRDADHGNLRQGLPGWPRARRARGRDRDRHDERTGAARSVSFPMRLALRDVFHQLLHEADDVRAIVLTGAGDHFCAGGDLSEMTEAPPIIELRDRIAVACGLFRQIHAGGKPVIAAVGGACMAPDVAGLRSIS